MKFFNSFLALPALALAAPTSSVSPLLAPRQSTPVQISSVSASGSGCPGGSWSIQLSSEGQTLQVSFNKYQLAIGPNIPANMRDLNCDVTIGLTYPAGCTSASISNTYHGFAELHTGVSATMTTQYLHSPGTVGPNPPPASIFGAFWQNGNPWQKSDSVTSRVQINSAGGAATYTIRTRGFVQSTNSQSFGSSTIDELTVNIERQTAC